MRILITEEALQSGSGHWPSYVGDIAAGLRDQGDHVDVIVHRDATQGVLEQVGGTPWFSRNCWVDPASQGGFGGIHHNYIFGRELMSWIMGHAPYDWVCALTMRLQHLLAFALIVRAGVVPKKTRFFLLFVQGFGRYAGYNKPSVFPHNGSTILARLCFRLMAPGVRSGRVVLAAETKGMQDELQRFTGLPVALAPHPVRFPLSQGEKVERREPVSLSPTSPNFRSQVSSFIPQPLTITCPGFARHEKGADLLQDAIRIILAGPSADRFHFVLQWPEPFSMPDGSMLGPDPRLLQDGRVKFLNGSLSSAEYEELMDRTDLVILPYRRNSYHHRVSRVAIEAAGRGIPIIYMQGTWSEEVAELAGGGVPVRDELASDVAESIAIAANNFPNLKEQAMKGSSLVRDFHSVRSLRNLLKKS